MRTMYAIGIALLLATAMTGPAGAQDDDGSCSYGGRRYASGFAVCQAGAVQVCVGGEWQGNGTFCGGAVNGASLGAPVLGPGQVDLDRARRPGAPIQNAPVDDD